VNFVNAILAALAWLSLALGLWQWLAARRFPLHRRVARPPFAPPLTVLKPLKGCDPTTSASLATWFNQDYAGPVQILFGVAGATDPVCKIVTELIAQNPGRDAQLVVCSELTGANVKAAKLAQLEKLAKHQFILVSDADVRVPPDFLANIVAPFCDQGGASVPASRPASDSTTPNSATHPSHVGLVNCFYRLANPTSTAMQWEAIAINADFWSQVLQAASLKPLDFALGAVMLTRRESLAAVGGFASLADCLADDYQLGRRIARLGQRIVLCPVVVECWDAPMNWRDVWQHQLRWARTIRVCRPVAYFFSILSNASLWPLLWLAASLISPATICALVTALAFLLIRIAVAQSLQRRFTPDRRLVSPFWLVPVRDLLQAMIWFCAFTGNTVEWRGRRMKLRSDGTVVEYVKHEARRSARLR
jgi:ceramide glucosyltransferase